ncbi:MAG: succinoglycan biosynthesis protein ExoA [Acidimicrobiaceae bacterium]
MSVCIVTARRVRQLERCLHSLRAQQDSPSFEVLVGADPDPDVVALVAAQTMDISVVEVAGSDERPLPPADKRNVLLARARGELLLFLDDDVIAAPDLLRRLVDSARDRPDFAVFGGPNLTPPNSSWFQVVQGAVLGSLVGAGPARRRYGSHPRGVAREPNFTLCNLAVRADAMVPFPPGMYGEECATLNDLRRRGQRMWYDPQLAVFHERRPTLRTFLRQMYIYGRGRGRVMRQSFDKIRTLFLLPLALLMYLALLPLLAAISLFALVPLALYAAMVVAQAAKIAASIPGRWSTAPTAAFLVVSVHVCYGVGSVAGMLARPRVRETGPAHWVDLSRP